MLSKLAQRGIRKFTNHLSLEDSDISHEIRNRSSREGFIIWRFWRWNWAQNCLRGDMVKRQSACHTHARRGEPNSRAPCAMTEMTEVDGNSHRSWKVPVIVAVWIHGFALNGDWLSRAIMSALIRVYLRLRFRAKADNLTLLLSIIVSHDTLVRWPCTPCRFHRDRILSRHGSFETWLEGGVLTADALAHLVYFV